MKNEFINNSKSYIISFRVFDKGVRKDGEKKHARANMSVNTNRFPL